MTAGTGTTAEMEQQSDTHADITPAVSLPPSETGAVQQYYLHAELSGLRPGETYYYLVGHDGWDVAGNVDTVRSFTTAASGTEPFTFTAFATDHLLSLAGFFKRSYPKTCFDCYGVTIEYKGKRFVYSADLAHPQELTPAVEKKKTTALLCELTHFPERELFSFLSRHAVKSLWITHYPDHLTRHEKELQTIARDEKFRGSVHLMHDKIAQEI